MSPPTESQVAVHKHFQIDLLVYHLEASVVQLFLSEARGENTLSEPLLSLLSFCHASLSLPLSPLFPGHTFTFSRLCSSRVVLSGPVLPETPRHISSFCLLSFPSQASVSLSLSLSPSKPLPRERKGSHLKSGAVLFWFPLHGSVSIQINLYISGGDSLERHLSRVCETKELPLIL